MDDNFFSDGFGKTLISMGQLKVIHSEQKFTIVYGTGNPLDAMEIATKIIVLQHGIIQQYDSPGNIYCRPSNYFVAGLIGTPPMNFFTVPAT